MAITATFDSASLHRAMQELSYISGRDFETVVRGEATKVLESALRNTVLADVAKIQQTRDPELKARRLAAIGLAKRAFVDVAESMKITPPTAPAKVKRARGGRADDTKGWTEGTKAKFTLLGEIDGSRSYPGAKMFAAINKAFRMRSSYFRRNLRNEFLNNLKDVARRYPYLKVNGR